jgi:3-deoxy-7-phosphoheptulonate synthase
MQAAVTNTRIRQTKALITPGQLAIDLPLSADGERRITQRRKTIAAILSGEDPRLLAIVGPCSVHDPKALLDFASRFKAGTDALADRIFPVLRVYFEKPRTVAGWKGLINDPGLDGSFEINRGLHLARQLLLEVDALGLPAANEFLDTTLGQYYADLISFGAIGARTVESQVHRELASGLSMPVGFKNGTNGDVQVAVDAIRSAQLPHWFPSLTEAGIPAIMESTGNEDCHLILRGGSLSGPNYSASHVEEATQRLSRHNSTAGIVIDCSHGNSNKDFRRQADVLQDVCQQLAQGQTAIRGVMLESHLVEGKQDLGNGQNLTYGQSVTDACLALDGTLALLEDLAASQFKRAEHAGAG